MRRDYYNSSDADRFYAKVWGGEDIHVGMYEVADEPIRSASHRTVEFLANRLEPLDGSSRVLDLGSGYGGAARYLADRFGCSVTCLNLSEVENERNRELNRQAGLTESIRVLDGSFDDLPFDDQCFDVAWSQDAILHSGNPGQVFREVDRVLCSSGQFVMTDPMQSDDCPDGVLQPILDRLHLSDLGSPRRYQAFASSLGWKDCGYLDQTHQLVQHYSSVLRTTEEREASLAGEISADYLDRMKKGLIALDRGRRSRSFGLGRFPVSKVAFATSITVANHERRTSIR